MPLDLPRMGVDTHLVAAHGALPLLLCSDCGLLVEMTDGTAEVNANYRDIFRAPRRANLRPP